MRLGGRHNMPPPLLTLTFDLLNLKSVWESHVTWGTPVQSFVFLGLLGFELEPMYATSDRQTDGRTDRRRTPNLRSPLSALPPPTGRGPGGITMLRLQEGPHDLGRSTIDQAQNNVNGILITVSHCNKQ